MSRPLAVLLPFAPSGRSAPEGLRAAAGLLLGPRVVLAVLLAVATLLCVSEAWAQLTRPMPKSGVFETLARWTPLVLLGPPGEIGGLALNILISFLAMAIGTVTGAFLGLGQISRLAPVRAFSWAATQFFRNSPWLVLLFFAMLLVPFEVKLAGFKIPFPGWLKATIGLALPVMANVSEIVRGAVNSIPSGQWESSESLAFSRWQTLWMIILPQCVKRMTPPWMNLYAILTMATPLVSIVGVSDAVSLTREALTADGRSEMLMPMYGAVLAWFFLYCYPIARWTIRLERRFAVIT